MLWASLSVLPCILWGDDAEKIFKAAEHAPAFLERVDDKAATGGRYVAVKKDWSNVLNIPVPDGKSFSVWVRYRGVPVCLKTQDESGEFKELLWIYQRPEDWEWKSWGTFTKEQLGSRILVMSGRNSAENAGVDAVFFGKPDAKALGMAAQEIEQDGLTGADASLAVQHEEDEPDDPVVASIEIDWDRPVTESTRRQFSLNANMGARPQYSGDAQYQENIRYMNPAVLRYHKGTVPRGQPKTPEEATGVRGWIDMDARAWSVDAIRESFSAFNPREMGIEPVICIQEWPYWMDVNADRLLDEDKYEEFAELCAELVRIMNVELGLGIRYFEITNERDFVYWRHRIRDGQPVLVDEFAKIFNLCSEAMKEVDPSIKIGGPTSCRGEPEIMPIHQRFAELTLPNLDFFSFHCYITGTEGESDMSVYDRVEVMGEMMRNHREMLDKLSPDRYIEVHLNEYNIAWTWKINEPRMRNHKGAVFDSLFFVQAVKNGLDVGNAWNECDSTYGKMNSKDYGLRPSAHAFHYFNEWMAGRVVESETNEPRKVVPLAVDNGERRTLVLINRSGAENQVDLHFRGWSPDAGEVEVVRIDADGLTQETQSVDILSERLLLPPHSVTFFSYKPEQPKS